MDNNFENHTPESSEDAKPETTYTDPNAGATYTYGAVPKEEAGHTEQESAETEAGTASGQPETEGTGPDAGYQQPKESGAQTENGYRQPTPEYGGAASAGGQQSQGYSQPNTGYSQPEYTQPNTGYQQDYQYQNHYNTNYNSGYNNNYHNPGTEGMDTTPLSMGEWLLTLLAAVIPCAGLILYCIWAFGKTGNIHRRNFCRASLILQAISIVLSIVFVIFVAFAGVSSYSYYY